MSEFKTVMTELTGLLKMSQEELALHTEKEMHLRGYRNIQVNRGGYVYAEGSIPVLLVAHLDTVHREKPQTIHYDRVRKQLSSPQGLGADDRAGVYAALEIIKSGLDPHILFTHDEEIGCLGAKAFVGEMPCPDIHYVIQLDRQGDDEAVFYGCENETFINYILDYGFRKGRGTSTDIRHLCPQWDLAGTNLSIGYYNQHTASEVLNIEEMLNTTEKTKGMLSKAMKHQHKFHYN